MDDHAPYASDGKLLKEYFCKSGYAPEVIPTKKGETVKAKAYIHIHLDPAWETLTSFQSLYALLENKFSEEDAMELLDFYLPKKALEWYSQFSIWAEDYTRAVTKAVQDDLTIPEDKYDIQRLSVFDDPSSSE